MNKILSRSHADKYHLNSPPLKLILLRDFQLVMIIKIDLQKLRQVTEVFHQLVVNLEFLLSCDI